MVTKFSSPKPDYVRVVFELPASLWAQTVFVVGNFAGQDSETAVRMRQERDGLWRAALDLPVDRQYEFRYLIDSRWCCDFQAATFPAPSSQATDSYATNPYATGQTTRYADSFKCLLDTARLEAGGLEPTGRDVSCLKI